MNIVTTRQRRALGALVLSAACASSAAAQAGPRYYAGRVTFRGDDLPVRVTVLDSAGKRTARLDLPTMGMAGEPLEVVPGAEPLAVRMPFELGTFRLAAHGDTLACDTVYQTRGGPQMMRMVLVPGTPPPYRETEVTFASAGGVRIAGTLTLPDGPGPHPAVVLVPACCGDGRGNWAYRSWADWFARHGYAALAYDKRGTGSSTGDWQADSAFAGLADDVVAAADFLRERPEVDGTRIGLSGGSQAGWVIPLAAPRVHGLSFVVLRSPPAASPGVVEAQSVEARMRAAGASSDGIADALAHLGLFFYATHSGRGWSELRASVRANRARGWAEFVPMPDSAAQMGWWARHADFDAIPGLRALKVPVLALFGADDVRVPPGMNAERLRQAVADGGNSQVRMRIFPHADHRIEVKPGYDDAGAWHWFRLAPGMLEAMEEWLAAYAPATPPPGR
ncbi:MAG TPA: prolyl oligopeptidase family serine peptidase [Longimicrobiaceae bacterium]|jgi:pimeloyl-ACP methyl ester carboxylesterase|nr:prolyl oligopeptidase family serine peptidase [Longimicrobiaceae bacterium]